jgi:tellurite resistance protein
MPKRQLPRRGSASQVALEPEVAIAIIGIFSAYADDEGAGDAEAYALGEMLSSVSGFEEYSEEDFQELAEKAIAVIEEEGPDAAIEQAIASLPEEGYREAAYITALMVVAIDGELPETEEDYMAGLQQALDISDERASEIIDEIFGEEEEEEEE